MNEIVIKENGGVLYADSRDVAGVLGIDHKSVLQLLRDNSELDFSDFKTLKSTGGRPGYYAELTERQCLIMITFVKNTDEAIKAKVALVDAFLGMREYIKNADAPLSEIEKSEKAASIFINLVRPSESGRMLLARNVCTKHGLPTDVLLDYSGEPVTKSMTELLTQYGYPCNARLVNRKLIEKGILEEITRKSTTKGEKKYLSITKVGEKFGKNLVSPQNPRESHPHWFESEFRNLMEAVS